MNTKYFKTVEEAISDLVSLLADSDNIANPTAMIEEGEFKTIALDSPKKPLSSIFANLRGLEECLLPSLQYEQLLTDNYKKLNDLIVNGYQTKEAIDDEQYSHLLRAIVHLGAHDHGKTNTELFYVYAAHDPAKNGLTTLLLENNANVNVYAQRKETKITPLIVCLFYNPDPSLIQLMLEHGAIDENFNALKIALTHCSPEISKILLKHQKDSIDRLKVILLDEKETTDIPVATIAGFQAPVKKEKLKKTFLAAVHLLEQEGEYFSWLHRDEKDETRNTMQQVHDILGLASQKISKMVSTSLTHRETKSDPSALPQGLFSGSSTETLSWIPRISHVTTAKKDEPTKATHLKAHPETSSETHTEATQHPEQSKLSQLGSAIGSTLFSMFVPDPIRIKDSKVKKTAPAQTTGAYLPSAAPVISEIR